MLEEMKELLKISKTSKVENTESRPFSKISKTMVLAKRKEEINKDACLSIISHCCT